MQFSSFEIENFRGIQNAKIDLAKTPLSLVYALVGLNESGKTTVLEAINHFTYKKESLAPLELPGYSITDVHELIPIAHQSNFNGYISFKFVLSLNEIDEQLIKDFMRKELGFILIEPIERITVHRKICFKDSNQDPTRNSNLWSIKLKGTKGNKSKKIVDFKSAEAGWPKVVEFITSLMPSVLYFPNFLFDFPDRIYLEDLPQIEDKKSKFYRLVLQDILDSLDQDLNLDIHVLDRAKSGEGRDQKHLDHVLLSMGRHVTDTVFGAWNKIFDQHVEGKRVQIACNRDEKSRYFIEFKLEDADGYFYINQRSLGFRWFFVFLLLTKYRGDRKDSPNDVLFLFDEPASNLHPSAQTQLLESFKKFPNKCQIIYTTHSHHLINPQWLESIFVVKNEGLDYKNDAATYNSTKTNITVTKYREFAIKHPDQTDYYRPILDVLDYVPSKFDNIPEVVMVEGKNDFYTLSFMQRVLKSEKLSFLPGTSSSNLEPVIRLYISWGSNFVILLDSDEAGKSQKNRYENIFEYLLKNRIFDLSDANTNWKNFEMESLFSDNDRVKIQKIVSDDQKFNKTHFNRAIQQLLVNNDIEIVLEDSTKNNFIKLIDFMSSRLKENTD